MTNHQPPKLAERILEFLLYDDVWKSMMGDLQEYYDYLIETKGKRKATLWYWGQILRFAPSKIIHKMYWTAEIFRNYLKISFRNILKYKGYSSINILGLAIGLASFLLIGLFVIHEMSYDRYHKDADRTYRIVRDAPSEFYLGTTKYAVSPMPLSIALSDNFAGIETSAYLDLRPSLLKVDQFSFFEQGLITESNYFELFSHRWISGKQSSALNNPESIVLTRSTAQKYFGDSNPMGKAVEITYDDEAPMLLTVTGVIEDVPSNSHLNFDFILPFQLLPEYERESTFWLNNNIHIYAKIDGSVSTEELSADIKELIDPHLLAINYYSDNPDYLPTYELQPLSEVYLNSSNVNFNAGTSSSYVYIYMLSGIAFIILIVASINYMNLATARSMLRAKEVGVRKVNGAFSSNIMMQFISEALVFSFLGIILAFLILISVFPSFAALLGSDVSITLFNSFQFWVLFLLVGLIVGLFSGSYPALFLSRLSPIGVFKKALKGGKTNKQFQRVLVIGQFAITNILILSSLVIFLQLDFIRSKDPGYSRDQIVSIKVSDPELMSSYEVLRQRLLSNSNIQRVTSGSNLPTKIDGQTSGVNWEGKPEGLNFDTFNGSINTGYLEMLGIDMVTGRYFNTDFDTDSSNHYIINEQLAKGIGWTPEEAIGQDFELWRRDGKVIGVVKDFNFMSYHSGVAPLLLRYENVHNHNFLLINISPNDVPETLSYIEEVVTNLAPEFPIEYAFLDDTFNNLYENEATLGTVFNHFTLLALFIACMGLFGLASFMMEQRTKEIGVRKVLGANVCQIMSLLNRDFLQLVGISFLISIPIGWILANQWLENFAYKITVGPVIFIAMGIATLGIALITVSYRSFKAAMANPVESLRGE